MSKVNELFEKELCVVNFGIESFYCRFRNRF